MTKVNLWIYSTSFQFNEEFIFSSLKHFFSTISYFQTCKDSRSLKRIIFHKVIAWCPMAWRTIVIRCHFLYPNAIYYLVSRKNLWPISGIEKSGSVPQTSFCKRNLFIVYYFRTIWLCSALLINSLRTELLLIVFNMGIYFWWTNIR